MMTGFGSNQYSHYTAYYWTHRPTNVTKNQLMTAPMNGKTCRAVQLQFIARHGSRFTDASNMRKYTSVHSKLIESGQNSEHPFLNTWTNDYNEDKAWELTALGMDEMRYLGAKYGKSLYDLFQMAGSRRFTSSNTSRAIDSANEFKNGINEELGRQNTLTPVKTDERRIRFYNGCPRYTKDVRSNDALLSQMTKFEEGNEFKSVIENVKRRLQISTPLTADDVKVIRELCSIELGAFGKEAWCHLLSDEDREILQYGQDIEDYLIRFGGDPLNKDVTCPLMKDIEMSFETAIKQIRANESYDVMDVRIGHFSTVSLLLNALGLYQDTEPLKADNFMEMRDRQFMSSCVVPMSANVAFVLYICDSNDEDDYAVRVIVNDADVIVPGCGSTVCEYRKLINQIQTISKSCDYDKFCEIDTSSSSTISISIYFLFIFWLSYI
ncbi:hypothetical protein FSP39_007278 [Pinctada imbricata]|uniref:Multiple inositol polyphosphate phosphatase 1 n=1 Tax=Pinctada imbricata TaxID=66713 RepID=A0AA89BQ50_PINIB|nr:hypothetical protein FSP39_007278 [Pinctada imbricata]